MQMAFTSADRFSSLEPGHPDQAMDIHTYFHQLERRFQIGLLLAFLIPLTCLSIYFHFQFHVTLKETGKLNLAAIAESQRNTVDLFLQERLVNIYALFHSAAFNLSPSQNQMQVLLDRLRQSSDAFVDIGFLNQTGFQIGYAGPYPFLQNKNYIQQEWFSQFMAKERTHYISDIYLGFRNKPHFTIAAKQVVDGNPYVLKATLDPDKFYLFLKTINHGKGVESAIINRQGRFQLADSQSLGLEHLQGFVPPVMIISDAYEIKKNGDSILVAHAWLKETPWALLVAEPLRLAYAQLYKARRIMWISTTIILAVVVAAIWFSTRDLIGMAKENAEKRQELQGQLLHATRLASLGELATGVAHEINNPMAIIVATTGVIRDMLNPDFHLPNDPATLSKELETIETAAFRVKGITQQLLNYGRKTQPEMVPCDINTILEEVLQGFKERELTLRNILVQRDFQSDLPAVIVDPNQIRQVFLNLINNAGDAINGAGQITLSTRLAHGRVHVCVTDTGRGMDADRIKKIFNPFYTTKEVGKGTGLGLSVSLGIVESMGGTIEVQSLPGAGSAFTVVLPSQPSKGVHHDCSDRGQEQ